METQDKRLAQLARATTRLVQMAEDLRRECDRLQGRLSAMEHESQGLRREVATLREERETIRKRLEVMDATLSQALTAETDPVPPTKDPPARAAKATATPAVEELTLF
jgi:chromosome segregation ATPase